MTTVTTKATKITLLSLLVAGDVKGLVEYYITKGATEKDISDLNVLFSKLPAEMKKALAAQEKEEKRAQKEQDQLNKKIAASTKIARKAFVTELLKVEGMTKENAELQADKVFGVVERVSVSYNGTEFEVARRGKAPADLAKALEETNLTRDEFIEKYEI